MRTFHGIPLIPLILLVAAVAACAEEKDTPPKENNCLLCHGNGDVWEGEKMRFFITEADLAKDIHWQKGLRCTDCHGGNAQADEPRAAHAEEDGFHTVKSPADVPKFCGDCHANIEFQRRYKPYRAPINSRNIGPAATASGSKPGGIRR